LNCPHGRNNTRLATAHRWAQMKLSLPTTLDEFEHVEAIAE
jgi:hypothetical protein